MQFTVGSPGEHLYGGFKKLPANVTLVALVHVASEGPLSNANPL